VKPRVLICSRRSEMSSSDPTEWEAEFLKSINLTMPFLGSVCWLSPVELSDEWTKKVQEVESKRLNGVNFHQTGVSAKLDSQTVAQDLAGDLLRKADTRVQKRCRAALEKFRSMKFAVERVIKEYKQFKEESTRFTASDFYQVGSSDLDEWNAKYDFPGMQELKLPPKEMLYFAPFLSKIFQKSH